MDWFTAPLPLSSGDNKEDTVSCAGKHERRQGEEVRSLELGCVQQLQGHPCQRRPGGAHLERKCKPFTQEVIYQMMGVYIINGLSPSPKLEKKIQP